MSHWYTLQLGNEQQAFEPLRQIQQVFMARFLMAQPGTGRALFSHFDAAEGRVVLFFSPAAADIAVRFRASPCDRPAQDLVLLAGEGDAWHDAAQDERLAA